MKKLDPKKRLEVLEAVFGALAHPSRRQILLTIHFRGGEISAGDIAKRFSCAWPTTSGHLKLLVEAGLIQQEKQGRVRLYRLNHEKILMAQDWLEWFKGKSNAHGKEEKTKH
jgi:DNA-binding transcriptional ArsR family regulator